MFNRFNFDPARTRFALRKTRQLGSIASVLVGSLAFASYGIAAALPQPTEVAPPLHSAVVLPPQSAPLEGGTWQLTEWRFNKQSISLLPKQPITIQFDGKRLGGSTGCNSYGADYRINRDRLWLQGQIVSTMIGCAPEVAQREQQFLTALQAKRVTLRQTHHRLVVRYVTNAGEGTMVFTRALPLQNTTWQLQSAKSQPPITVRFSADKLGGFSGCNQFSASYQQRLNQLKVGAIASTKKACAPSQMQLEQQFLSQVARVQRYEINRQGNLQLFFQQSNQSGVLTFKPVTSSLLPQ